MDLVNRLKQYMEFKNIAISQFADTCYIPRPTMSQILNGRNKKVSDELISKIHTAYPDLSVLWLMFGEGEMLAHPNTQTSAPQNTPDLNSASTQPIGNESLPQTSFSNTSSLNSERNSTDSQYIVDFESFSDHDATRPDSYDGESRADSRAASASPDSLIDFEDLNELPISDSPLPASEQRRPISSGESAQASAWQSSTRRQSAADPSPSSTTPTDSSASAQRTINLITTPDKRITNIVVFYSDNSFQSFYPAML